MNEPEPKLGWATKSLDDALVASHLEKTLGEPRGTVMIDGKSRWGRSQRRHLRLHRDGRGFFVRVGRRGAGKAYLGRCKVTYFDGKPELFQFTFSTQDAFEAEQSRRYDERYNIGE